MIYESGNSQLLIDYRKKLVEAFVLGEEIKAVYGVNPPKAILEDEPLISTNEKFSGRIGLEVAGTRNTLDYSKTMETLRTPPSSIGRTASGINRGKR
jgi:hypothetical protein